MRALLFLQAEHPGLPRRNPTSAEAAHAIEALRSSGWLASYFMAASREAYDLHNPACRANAWYRLKRGDWKRLWFLRLIRSDTINNVCTVRKANTPSLPRREAD